MSEPSELPFDIIDAHHHIWPKADLPWLNGPMQPRIFGPYESIMRDYLVDEYKADCSGNRVVKSVYVQANWATERFEDEVAWVQKVADEYGLVQGIVGYVDMTVDDVRPALDRLKKYPLMRGVRQQLHWHENPLYRFAATPDLARDPTVQANIATLSDYDWSFDLQVFPSQMAGAAELASACPDTTFVLQHAGMHEDLSNEGWQEWQNNMQLLAAQPNVCSKLSAFGTFIHRNDEKHIASMINATVDLFGSDRCLFGSNFPIEKIWTSYNALIKAFIQGSSHFTQSQQLQLFQQTAARVYRL